MTTSGRRRTAIVPVENSGSEIQAPVAQTIQAREAAPTIDSASGQKQTGNDKIATLLAAIDGLNAEQAAIVADRLANRENDVMIKAVKQAEVIRASEGFPDLCGDLIQLLGG